MKGDNLIIVLHYENDGKDEEKKGIAKYCVYCKYRKCLEHFHHHIF